MRNRFAAIALVFGILFAGTANADSPYVGHCQDDASIPPENILAACAVFIDGAFAQNWQLGYVPYAMVDEAIADERLGKDEDAEKILKAAIKRYPDFPLAWERLGELLEKQKGGGVLMATMDAMIQANPNNPDVLSSACWIRARAGEQLDAAMADCNESLRLRPGDADTLDSRAFAYFRNEKYAEAIADANAALAIDPKLASSFYVRGLAELKSGNPTGGDADIAAAKAIDKDIADVYQGTGAHP
jgi:tetratricopeptide (TPR) repeat protein